jgi:hypothetical protein
MGKKDGKNLRNSQGVHVARRERADALKVLVLIPKIDIYSFPFLLQIHFFFKTISSSNPFLLQIHFFFKTISSSNPSPFPLSSIQFLFPSCPIPICALSTIINAAMSTSGVDDKKFVFKYCSTTTLLLRTRLLTDVVVINVRVVLTPNHKEIFINPFLSELLISNPLQQSQINVIQGHFE